ncbi:MAG: hypothetical protein IH614_13695 [Desulfuromonadales bacterium]|nr:hypothetical protein [Desulfuromonadales bacterium]
MAGRKKLDPKTKPTLAEQYAGPDHKERIEDATAAAWEAEEMTRRQGEIARQEQEDKEHQIAQCHQAIGRIQAAKMFAKFGNVSELMWVNDVKETKIYKDVPGLETWERFCNSLGYTAKHIDDQLKNLNTFGAAFLETVSDLRVGHRELRKLRQLTHDGAIEIDAETIQIGDERILLADKEELQDALERLIEAKDALLQEKEINLRTKERLIQDKQKLVERQARDLARYEGEAEKKGLSADEEAFIKQCTTARVTIDGLFSRFDPDCNPLPENATARMKAALMETLGYFKRVADATYDTAGDLYGDPELDGNGWVQPNLRAASELLAQERQKKTGQEG